MHRFNWIALICGVVVWLGLRTLGAELGLAQPVAGFGAAIVGAIVFALIDRYWQKKK